MPREKCYSRKRPSPIPTRRQNRLANGKHNKTNYTPGKFGHT